MVCPEKYRAGKIKHCPKWLLFCKPSEAGVLVLASIEEGLADECYWCRSV
jgi:hypothetical protein